MKCTATLYFLVIFLLVKADILAQLPGCTDPLANNFNASATVNNGSCTYNSTGYTPEIKVDPLSDSVPESSGLQMAGGYLWTFNDRGGKPCLYRLDSTSNTITQRVILAGVTNGDWEDIAFDGSNLYIGDFGNNQTGGRTDLRIYKFPFSSIHLENAVDTIPFNDLQIINFIYADQPQPVQASGYNNTAFDCEAMIVDNKKIHLFSKNWVNNTTTHYRIDADSAGSYTAVPMETLNTGYLVTAADKVAGENIIVLLGYQNSGTGNHYLHILSDYKADSFFTGNKRRIDLPDATVMGQSEGISFRDNRHGYISNEQFVRTVGPFTLTVNQKLSAFDISPFTGSFYTQYEFTGNGLWTDTGNWKYQLAPPATLFSGNSILINPISNGQCLLNIPYSLPQGSRLTVAPGKNFEIPGNLHLE